MKISNINQNSFGRWTVTGIDRDNYKRALEPYVGCPNLRPYNNLPGQYANDFPTGNVQVVPRQTIDRGLRKLGETVFIPIECGDDCGDSSSGNQGILHEPHQRKDLRCEQHLIHVAYP